MSYTEARNKHLKIVMDIYLRQGAVIGTLLEAPVALGLIRTVYAAQKQGEPYDVSSLAAEMGVPISTMHRQAKQMEERNCLNLERLGRRLLVLPPMLTESTEEQLENSVRWMISSLL